jgi:hypothetical protein
MIERQLDDLGVAEKLSRRSLVAGATFFGAAMAAMGEVVKAEGAGSGSYGCGAKIGSKAYLTTQQLWDESGRHVKLG